MDLLIPMVITSSLLVAILIALLIISLSRSTIEEVHTKRVKNDLKKIKSKILNSEDEF
jgi:uncharacterized protein (DUF2062 family)